MNIVSHFVKYNIFTRATKYLSNEDKSQTVCEYLVVFKQYSNQPDCFLCRICLGFFKNRFEGLAVFFYLTFSI